MHSRRFISTNVWQTAMAECEAMADHAFASGTEIPVELMTLLHNISYDEVANDYADEPSAEPTAKDKPLLRHSN